VKWQDLPPEEKKRRRAQHRESKKRRDQFEKEKKEHLDARYASDVSSKKIKPGDWVRFRTECCPVHLYGKIARVLSWNDDGHNRHRAPRNKKATFLIEPHKVESDEHCETYRGKLQEVVPANEMEVIAEAAR